MDDVLTVPLASVMVTAEDHARYDPADDGRAREVAGDRASPPGEPFEVLCLNGEWHPVPPGYVVVRYGLGDAGVMSPGAFERFFGRRP